MVPEPLVYNRTKEDVRHVLDLKSKALNKKATSEELNELAGDMRGTLNRFAMKRVADWIDYLTSKLSSYGYPIEKPELKYWADAEPVRQADVDTIRKSITSLRDGFFSIPEWRELIMASTMSIDQANAMEWDLQQCYDWLERVIIGFCYSGEFFAGEV